MKALLKNTYIKYLNNKYNRKYNDKYEKKQILDKTFLLRKNSIKESNDYDYAWLLFLGINSKIIYDVGCNVGQSSILLYYNNNSKKIVLIEPNPFALSLAAENIIINNLSEQTTFIAKAASNTSGDKVKLWGIAHFSGRSILQDFSESGNLTNNSTLVTTTTLDDIYSRDQLLPDLIKIDVEGAEVLVLEGSTKIASNKQTKFFVEVHSSNRLSIIDNTQKILDWCKKNNYKAFYLSEHIELKDSNYIKHRGRYHILLLPKEKEYPKGLSNIKQGADFNEIKSEYYSEIV
tara:strand:+ start:173 stop:1042 length:870 start_codon:yes stop_codon:yes gene_type:complete